MEQNRNISPIPSHSKHLSHTTYISIKSSLLQFLLNLLLLNFLPLPLLLLGQLIRPPHRNILRSVIAKISLQDILDEPAADIIHQHQRCQSGFELSVKWNKTELLVEFRDELRRAGEGNAGCEDEAPEHAAVFADGFAERAALVVYGEGGNLLD